MARAYGWNTRLLLGFEPSFGVVPAGDKFTLIPFISSTLDGEQDLIESSVLGGGRDPSTPFHGVIELIAIILETI
ncbi:phage tail tube protein [Bartonella sp. DGB2]|uniref:phage tail tube protein n=1 Tax=Bartonella sp. DGB2 TaxID=3388426 RepID=UPI0039901C47